MRSHQLNSKSSYYVWNDIWARDVYARSNERLQRAKRRAEAFNLNGLISSNAIVLDIGCGSGELLGILAERSRLLVGLDRSATALNLAKKRNPVRCIRYLSGAAEALPVASNSFDNVIAFGVIEHVRDYAKVVSEMHRVMKPGATAFVSSSNANSSLQIKNWALAAFGKYPYGFQRNWMEESLKSALQERFLVRHSFFMHADNDMPIIRNLDRLISYLVSGWARYVCFVVSKEGS